MSKPRYIWWSYAKAMIRQYPVLMKEYNDLHRHNTAAIITGVPGGNSMHRTTETVALRQLPPARQREYDAVEKAIVLTKRRQNGAAVLALIDLVLWKQTHNLAGAAQLLYISESTANRYHSEFIRLVGFCYGLEDPVAG